MESRQSPMGFDQKVEAELNAFIERSAKIKTRKIAIFDADGTLWSGDIGEDFFQFQLKSGHISKDVLNKFPDPWNLYLNEIKKSDGNLIEAYGWLAQWNSGLKINDLKKSCDDFFKNHFSHHIFKPIQKFINQLNQSNFEIWVVSASMKWIVASGAKAFGIPESNIIGVHTAIQNETITDQIIETVPFREKKVIFINKYISADPLFVAGNTYWDKEMMLLSKDLTLAIHSEDEHGVNYKSEKKLQEFAQSVSNKNKNSVIWLTQKLDY